MPNTRIKICGITRPEDAVRAADLGADAIGLNFVGGPRRLETQSARKILTAIPPCVTAVALVSENPQRFPQALSTIQLLDIYPPMAISTLQIYGWVEYDLSDPKTGFNCWMVSPVENRETFEQLSIQFASLYPRTPAAIVLDTASPAQAGGTGQSFNWKLVSEAREAGHLDLFPPLILAGGLTPDNVADAIRIAKPYAVDVSSGVEIPGQPGIKDPIKMRDFIQAVKGALA